MDHLLLDDYIKKYYDSWYSYAKYLCNGLGLRAEAYDVFMSTVLQLLQKKESDLISLLECEQSGEHKLLYYTKVMIKYNVFQIRNIHNRNAMYSYDDISFYSNHYKFSHEIEAEIFGNKGVTDIDNEKRVIESRLRDDSLITPFPTERIDVDSEKISISVRHYIPMNVKGKSGSVRCVIYYTAEVKQKVERKTVKKLKYFPDKGSAMQWALQYKQNINRSL